MTVMRFPKRRNTPRFEEHEPDDDGAGFDPYAAGEECPYADEPPLPEAPRRNARTALLRKARDEVSLR